ncbi:Putative zinc transporter msc2 [Malassezia nana]|uniref:Zinc transporter msc2 n=1 Tax=Malassezia nana TaxID=180528 RepID=A0AAF0EN41_9BASI|nr:Putative zinc transporter msc2 [Malassezia nana]
MVEVSALPTQPDPRLRGHFKWNEVAGSSMNASQRIRIHHLLALLLTKTLVASAAWLTRQWLLVPQVDAEEFVSQISGMEDDGAPLYNSVVHAPASVWAVATMSTSFAALLLMVSLRVWRWHIEWTDHTIRHIFMLGAVLFVQLLLWLTSLQHLGATTTLIFTQFCELWVRDIRISRRWTKSGGPLVVMAMLLSLVVGLFTGSAVSLRRPFADTLDDTASRTLTFTASLQDRVFVWDLLKGYAALLCYAILSIESGHLMFMASKQVRGRRRAMVLGTSMIALLVLPLSTVGAMLGFKMLPAPLVPRHEPSAQDALEISHLGAYLVLAVGVLIFDMLVTLTLESYVTLMVHVAHAWPMAIVCVMAIGFAVFNVNVNLVQFAAAVAVGFSLFAILRRSPLYMTSWYRRATLAEQRVATAGSDSDTTALSDVVVLLYRVSVQLRRMVHAILQNSDSRRIFYFLVLNLAFMGIQLVWGVWTNSLGLISDAIHMFFDCAAIFMGLVASVMASWETDDAFPFGYKRVETLSGFANGIFLVLISVFILFEAIQRIIEPPVMNNVTQLLIVSTLGLLVNLFGMFAMGHHHHHHHHHGHSHDHDHDHDHHGHSHNMLGLYLHVMADTLGSVGVIISTLLIQYFHWTGFDPIASLLIGLMILGSVVPLVIDSGRILCLDLSGMDTSDIKKALQKVCEIPGVAGYTKARFWPLDGESMVGSIPKGKMQNISGIESYVIGNEETTKVIVGIFDIFGFWPSTQQGADLLAAATNMRVILPDFFAGSPLPQDAVPWDTPEKKATVEQFLSNQGSPIKCRDTLLTVAQALKESGVTTLGLYGLCWGSKGAALACGEGTPFSAFVQIHPSFVNPQDACQIRIPVASFTSMDEPQELLEQFYNNLQTKSNSAGTMTDSNYAFQIDTLRKDIAALVGYTALQLLDPLANPEKVVFIDKMFRSTDKVVQTLKQLLVNIHWQIQSADRKQATTMSRFSAKRVHVMAKEVQSLVSNLVSWARELSRVLDSKSDFPTMRQDYMNAHASFSDCVNQLIDALSSLQDELLEEHILAGPVRNADQAEKVFLALWADFPFCPQPKEANQMKGATIEALVIQLTRHDHFDHKFTSTFMFTYRSFTNAETFIDLLIDRYHIQPPDDMDHELLNQWYEQKKKPIQLRVINVIKQWLECQLPLPDEMSVLDTIEEFFATNVAYSEWKSVIDSVSRLLGRAREAKTLTYKATAEMNAPTPILPISTGVRLLLDLSPVELARQLTIREHELFRKITVRECLGKAWTKSTAAIYAKNVMNVIIVQQRKKFESLDKITDASRNYHWYREKLASVEPPCVPFFGLYAKDLTFIEDGNADKLPAEPHLINFGKRLLMGEVLMDIRRHQMSPYDLKRIVLIEVWN